MNSSVFFRVFSRTITKFNGQSGVIWPVQIMPINRLSTNVSISQKNEKESFLNTLPLLTESLVSGPKFSEVPEVGSWMKKVLEYNVSRGKKSRGLATVYTYEMVEKSEKITEESMQLARIMGWCVEMLHTHLLLLDDIMDGSSTRRGHPCWYRLPEVGLGAVNDAVLVHMAMFHIMKKYFSQNICYVEIVDLFHETLLNTSIGQHLDYMMAHRNKNDYDLFTIEKYSAIVRYKTAYYTFKLPMCLGLYLADNADKETHRIVEEISIEIGDLFQIQDDYIDCFSDESVSGKAGTDIQEGKCTWLAVMALQRCNAEQRLEFESCYGSKDPNKVQRIKRLYEALELPRLYKEYEQNVYDSIVRRAKSLASGEVLPPALVLRVFEMIHHRKG